MFTRRLRVRCRARERLNRILRDVDEMREVIDNLIYERKYLAMGYSIVAGIDEAGRGPLAGPVTVACCAPDFERLISGVDDSKAVSPKKREELFDKILELSRGCAIVDIEPAEIDEINILRATEKGMARVAESIAPRPDMLLIDAAKPDISIPHESIIRGDRLSYSIAAASILAKVHRDRLMREYAKLYPQYGFEKHKGYGTESHIERLRECGPCPIHRMSFIRKFLA